MIESAPSPAVVPASTARERRPRFAGRTLALALALFVFALLVRLGWAAALRLDGLYGQDSYYLLEEGEALWRTGRHTGWDAVGAPALIAALLALGDGHAAVVQGGLAILGALSVLMTVALARGLGLTARVAWLAGGLMALAPEHIAQSLLVMTDGPALFWLLGGTVGAVYTLRGARGPWVLLAVPGLAAAIATRYVTGLVFPAVMVLCWMGARHRSDDRERRPVASPAGLGLWMVALTVAGAILYLEWRHSQIRIPSAHMLREWSPANAFRREFDDARGAVTLPFPVALGYLRALASGAFFSPFLLLCAVIGWSGLRRAVAGRFLGVWVVTFPLFLCGLHVVNRRYLLPILPPLAICAAAGLAAAVEFWQSVERRQPVTKDQPTTRRHGWATTRVRDAVSLPTGRWSVLIASASVPWLAPALAAVLALTMGVGTLVRLRPVAARKERELALVRWMETHTPAGSRVGAVDVAGPLRRYGSRPVMPLHLSDPATWELPGGETPGLYVVWTEAFVQRHLLKRPEEVAGAPELAPHIRWLQTRARLTAVGRVADWTVWRVNARSGPADGRGGRGG